MKCHVAFTVDLFFKLLAVFVEVTVGCGHRGHVLFMRDCSPCFSVESRKCDRSYPLYYLQCLVHVISLKTKLSHRNQAAM